MIPITHLSNGAHVATGTTFDGADAAADHLSHAIALEPRFWPALVEKARLWATIGDWDQVEKRGRIREKRPGGFPSDHYDGLRS